MSTLPDAPNDSMLLDEDMADLDDSPNPPSPKRGRSVERGEESGDTTHPRPSQSNVLLEFKFPPLIKLRVMTCERQGSGLVAT